MAAMVACTDPDQLHATEARRKVDAALDDGGLSTRQPEFFTADEINSARILADIIIPADDRSGAASTAHVAEFMDFIMIDQPWNQTKMRGGLAWMNHECYSRFQKPFSDCTPDQRLLIVEDIAWPDFVKPEHEAGADFFAFFRNLTATGFWSSKIGVEDLQYLGNVGIGQWDGCPKECTDHIGVSYDV